MKRTSFHPCFYRMGCFCAIAAIVFVFACGSGSSESDDQNQHDGTQQTGESADSISQFGITWYFDQAYESGQFANGDYWVVGPVTIVGIDPSSTQSDGRTMNGAMVNPTPDLGMTQGYDSAMYGSYGPAYDADLNAALDVSAADPLMLNPGSSLISTISNEDPGVRPQLLTAAILTVLDSAPPDGSFRPPYCGDDKTIRFDTTDLDYTELAALAPVEGTPDLADVERYFERPWIDHVPNWTSDYHHPSENMPYYGREMANEIGIGALMLHLDFTDEEKKHCSSGLFNWASIFSASPKMAANPIGCPMAAIPAAGNGLSCLQV